MKQDSILSSLPIFNPYEVTFTAFDIETTGSFPVSERVVEIGAVKFTQSGEILDEFNELVNPGIRIPSNVIRVHGIRNQDVKGKKPIKDVLPHFIDFIEDSILIAHNAAFDTGFLGVQMILCDLPFPPNPILDSIAMCDEFMPDVQRKNLRNMSRILGMDNIRCHRALGDSQIVRELFLSMTRGKNGLVDLDTIFGNFEPMQFSDAQRVFKVRIPKHMARIKKLVSKGDPLKINYSQKTDGVKGQVTYSIIPKGLFQHNRYAYLMAFCKEKHRIENYRLDRIKQISPA